MINYLCWNFLFFIIGRARSQMSFSSHQSSLLRNCDNELGMKSGDIRDDNLSVSSTVPGSENGKENARLNGESAWVAHANTHQWIQIDLGELKYVSGVKTQGKQLSGNVHLWVTQFKVLYKINPDQTTFQVVTNSVGKSAKVFRGNSDSTSVKTNMFPSLIQAQIIRIEPLSWARGTRKIALRLELLGCDIVGRSGCGTPRTLVNSIGFISSMNYPNSYLSNANCRWDIIAPTGKVVALRFLSPFHLEHKQRERCELDYVKVIDVVGRIEKSLGKFCGTTNPGEFISTCNTLKLQFVSDHFENYAGFKAKFSFMNESGCGGPQLLRGSEGAIQSMNYPANYINSAYCLWDIQTSSGKLLEVHFSDMDIVGTPMLCSDDSLQVIKFGSTTEDGRSQAVTRLCGNETPSDILSATNRMQLVFTTNTAVTSKGFRASYKTVASSGCASRKEYKDLRGTIQTPNYPEHYSNNLQCEWTIIANSYQDIRFQIMNINLESHRNCEYDYLSIYDGRRRQFLLGKYCDDLNIGPIVAHSGAMTIVFVSDERNTERGFEAAYEIYSRETATLQITPSMDTTTDFNEGIYNTNNLQSTTGYVSDTPTITTQNQISTDTKKNRNFVTDTNPLTRRTRQTNISVKNKNNKKPFVTEELAKWIIIGMIALTGFLVLIVGVGMIFCCKQQLVGGAGSLQGSLRNTNSGVVQNQAYDFSATSTTQSIPSRQIEDSSQLSESVSHQGTLRRDLNRDSHIYFSIDDYYNKDTSQAVTSDTTNEPSSSVKVHYNKLSRRTEDGALSDSRESSGGSDVDEVDEEEEVEDEENEKNSCEPSNELSSSEQRRGSSATESSTSQQTKVQSKTMVANVLYEPSKKNES